MVRLRRIYFQIDPLKANFNSKFVMKNRRVGHRADLKGSHGGLPYVAEDIWDMPFKNRKNIRLRKEAYSVKNQIFSVTICTNDRRPLFINKKWATMIIDTLKTGPFGKNVKCYAYCLMPDHLHLQLSPIGGSLIDQITGWKSYTTNLLQKSGLKGACWQRSFYDHALRSDEDIIKAADYIVNNPVRSKLVANWVDYPFSWHQWQ